MFLRRRRARKQHGAIGRFNTGRALHLHRAMRASIERGFQPLSPLFDRCSRKHIFPLWGLAEFLLQGWQTIQTCF